LHRRKSSALFAVAPRPSHFDKANLHANEHGHRCCNVADRSQVHDDNLRQSDNIKSRRVVSTLRLLNS
jgi:hypothetical protein